jgi:dTDP-4-amino-4,6-dideoxygalactose transaminase
MAAVFKENDETEGEEEKQGHPKQVTEQRHKPEVNLRDQRGQRWRDGRKLTLNRSPNLPSFSRMRVPLLDLSEQYSSLAEPIRQRLDEVLASQRFILGPNVEKFEKSMAQFTGAAHAIGVSSGTDALLAALMALGIGPGDAVITTPYSFFATAGCVARLGARPLFVDIDPTTYNISPERLTEFLRNECERRDGRVVHRRSGSLIRGIVPVHLFGLCCEMEAIDGCAREHDLIVIEDAAQAIGAECLFHGQVAQAGTMGACGCFSFYPSKNLGAAGDAGLVTCREEDLARRIRIFREHGMEPRYYHHVVGGNFRLDEIQAAILDVKLPYLNGWSAARRAAADFYRTEFNRAGLAGTVTLPSEPNRDGVTNHHIYHQFVIRVPRRDALRQHLEKKSIGSAIYYPLGLHEQDCFSYLNHRRGDFPETEKAAAETLALPIYPEISREAQTYVVESIAEFFD